MHRAFRLYRAALGAWVVLASGSLSGCREAPQPVKETKAMPARPIDAVLETHAPALMAVPGVVGVYQGEREDGRACIRVMLAEDNAAARARIPAELEGHPVEIEVSGEIRPLPGGASPHDR